MTHLKQGDKAPYFEGVDQNGNAISLSDFTGQKLILFFYPKDSTPGCTAEACNLRDNYEELRELGFEILGVSPDSTTSHQKFIDKHSLPFPLLADTEKTAAEAYGVWGEKNMYGRKYMGIFRTTFIIDDLGTIAHVFKKVKTKEHTQQILDAIE